MKTPTIEMDRWAGQYAIANSAGLVNVFKNRFQTLSQAEAAARIKSMSGFLGICWAVRLVKKLTKAKSVQ